MIIQWKMVWLSIRISLDPRTRMDIFNGFHQWEKKLPRKPLVDRDRYIIERCRGRDVVHLGACDSPMTIDKGEKGELLHQRLLGESHSLLGFDSNREATEILKAKFDISDIVLCDLSQIDNKLTPIADVVVCADLIEHVANVGNLMTNCNQLCREGGTILLSTIHALSLKQLMRALIGREPVHPDHVAYYSFATLGVILERSGFLMTDCRFFKYPSVTRFSEWIFDGFYSIFPQTADGIIVEALKIKKTCNV
jgi:SAM-dependent methyltransferase